MLDRCIVAGQLLTWIIHFNFSVRWSFLYCCSFTRRTFCYLCVVCLGIFFSLGSTLHTTYCILTGCEASAKPKVEVALPIFAPKKSTKQNPVFLPVAPFHFTFATTWDHRNWHIVDPQLGHWSGPQGHTLRHITETLVVSVAMKCVGKIMWFHGRRYAALVIAVSPNTWTNLSSNVMISLEDLVDYGACEPIAPQISNPLCSWHAMPFRPCPLFRTCPLFRPCQMLLKTKWRSTHPCRTLALI